MKTHSRIFLLLVALLVVLGSASGAANSLRPQANGKDAAKARLRKVVKASQQVSQEASQHASQEASKENSEKDAAAKEVAEEFDRLQFIVIFKRDATEEIIQSFEAGAKKVSEKLGIKVLKNMKVGKVSLDHSTEVDAAVKTLEALEAMEGVDQVVADDIQKVDPLEKALKPETKPVESDHGEGAISPRKVPDDEKYSSMWAPKVMNAEEAWDKITGAEPGSHRPVVLVIYSGVDYFHEDLADNMYINEAELHGDDGVDDDGNGYIDDVYGWNARTDTPNGFDDYGVGTHLAGTIGALGNNSLGVVGLHWRPRIVSCKFLDNSGWGRTLDALKCFDYAVAVGAEIINNSWGGGPYNLAVLHAFEMLGQQGIISVCASGNTGRNTDDNPYYPASYDVDSIISALSIDASIQKTWYSNYGKTSVDIAVPAHNIVSTSPGSYLTLSGTAMAAAQVSGALALLKAVESSLSIKTMRTILKNSTTKFLNSEQYTSWNGYLDLNKAVTKAMDYVSMIILAPPTMTCELGCAMSGMTCDEAKTAQVNTDLAECYSMLENSVIEGTFVQGESRSFDVPFPPPETALSPAGCFVEHVASTYVVNVNTYTYGIAEVGCEAPPSLLSTNDRACVCSPQT